MTERQLPEAMTDEQIVEACGELMGWKLDRTEDVQGPMWVLNPGEPRHKWEYREMDFFRPLDNWNHTMMVVALAEDFHLLKNKLIGRWSIIIRIKGELGALDGDDPQRSICLAALEAVSLSNDAVHQ